MRRCRFLHPDVRLCPRPSPVIATAHAASIVPNSFLSPHLWSRQIMRPTIHAPGTPFHLGIKLNPIRGVHPLLRYTSSGTNPGVPAVFTAEKSNIGCGDKLPVVIKRIKVVAVSGCYIQTSRDPSAFTGFSRIYSDPVCSSVRRAHCPSQIRPIADVGVLLRHDQSQGILSPIRSKSLGDPSIANIRGRLSTRIAVLFPNRIPIATRIRGLGNPQPCDSTFF